MKTKKRKFICDGCGKGRECYLETNQVPHNNGLDDYDLFTEDLKCVLDSTNQTSYNWKEVEVIGAELEEELRQIDQALLVLSNVVGRSEQLVCPDCAEGRDSFEPEWKCPECRRRDEAN